MEIKKSTHTCPAVQITQSRHSHMMVLLLQSICSLPAQEMDAKILRRYKDWGCMYSSQRCYGASDCALLLISQLPWERNCITLACEIECNSEFAARCCNRKNLGRYRGLWFWVWTPSTPTRCAKSVKNTHRIEKLANDHLGISVWITEIHSSQNSDLLYFSQGNARKTQVFYFL